MLHWYYVSLNVTQSCSFYTMKLLIHKTPHKSKTCQLPVRIKMEVVPHILIKVSYTEYVHKFTP